MLSSLFLLRLSLFVFTVGGFCFFLIVLSIIVNVTRASPSGCFTGSITIFSSCLPFPPPPPAPSAEQECWGAGGEKLHRKYVHRRIFCPGSHDANTSFSFPPSSGMQTAPDICVAADHKRKTLTGARTHKAYVSSHTRSPTSTSWVPSHV